jgi:hypothetical protein
MVALALAAGLLTLLLGCELPNGRVETVPTPAAELMGPCDVHLGPGVLEFEIEADLVRVWTVLEAGQRVTVSWPPGYSAVLSPVPRVVSPDGSVSLSHGDRIWMDGALGEQPGTIWLCEVHTEEPTTDAAS